MQVVSVTAIGVVVAAVVGVVVAVVADGRRGLNDWVTRQKRPTDISPDHLEEEGDEGEGGVGEQGEELLLIVKRMEKMAKT